MSIVADSVVKELQEAIECSKNYKTAIDNSKTSAKSGYWNRKLKKNNQKVANLLLALDRIEKAKYNMGNVEDSLK